MTQNTKNNLSASDTPRSPDQTIKEYQKLVEENRERLKELSCINQTTNILKQGKPIEEALQQIVLIIPRAMQYPEFTTARITFNGKIFTSASFEGSQWVLRETFETVDKRIGVIEIFYTKEFPEMDQGPFLNEEVDLINNLASLIKGYLDGYVAGKASTGDSFHKKQEFKEKPERKKLMQMFLNKNNYDRDIYHDLMPFKVKEILLVANLYDAFSIEQGGRFSEYVLSQYQQLNLTSVPRITGVSDHDEAMEYLHSKHFDMVILMVGVDKKSPVMLGEKIKKAFPYIPVFMLLNNDKDVHTFEKQKEKLKGIDRIFLWKGDSRIFFAMIKLIEDKTNVDNDTKVGLVRLILLVEDSAKYYSRYLPLLYNIVMQQTSRIIEDVNTDELYKVLRMRARPKIILTSTYEDAMEIFNKYKDNLLCLISDVEFKHRGKMEEEAGVRLVKMIKQRRPDLPTVIQSSDQRYADVAYELKASFINKNSESLMQDFESFITHYLGFGNFVYRDKQGREIATAKSLKEFQNLLKTIPDESILYHAKKDHFSLWLMARGEIQVARILHPAKIKDFNSAQEIREFLMEVIENHRNEQNKGKIIPFEASAIDDASNIVSLSEGNLGGKGRGLAFVNNLIYNYNFRQHVSDINIVTPKTFVIGTEEFNRFLDRNKLRSKTLKEENPEVIKKWFLEGELTPSLVRRLKRILKVIKKPMAVRSSGMFEDSLQQPFAGIFETYILPNNHPETSSRQKQLEQAIKLVYASVFSERARGYVEAINYKIEEEMMAVVLQEVVGQQYDGYFYPNISGVAQSYNYYPVAHMKPEEGFAIAAVGLGKYVVDGEKAFRFSPMYPETEIHSTKDQFKNSQTEFYAVDLNKYDIDLKLGDTAGLARLDIEKAEQHGTLKHCASVYDPDSDRITPGLNNPGPRIVNFANILKYNYIPLAKTIEVVLDIVEEAIGSPVEIEWAVDLTKDKNNRASFYLLQIKPLISAETDFDLDTEELDEDRTILYTTKGMGNGYIADVTDVIYVDVDKFDKARTEEMAREIDQLNKKMREEDKRYVLIGPGRWGTRDKWLGIPVDWPQISNAKVIVETSLEDFPLDASSGSHFFHNVTSMHIGYLTVQQEKSNQYIDYSKLNEQELVEETNFFRHVRFPEPMEIMMDGKQRISVVLEPQKEKNNTNETSG
ncbi:MAG: pyruvate, phosphate dikinase [Bacteroidales bacterium]|nr:pyruvate, phosphate dikinase [Bacteroidales bacterium]